MATQPGWAPWPFLAALMSSSASGDAPRVHGLGFVYRGVVVTLAHIAEAADLAEVAGGRQPASVRPLTAQDGLAVMTLERPPPKPVPVTLGLAKGPVEVAIASDIALSIRVLSGLVDEVDSAERFSVALNGRLGEDSTASGSPVVVGDTVVGIVAPTATSVSVDAFGAAAIERLVAPLDRPPPLAEGAMRAVGEALEIARWTSPPAAVVLGVLRSGTGETHKSIAVRLLDVVGSQALVAAYERFVDRPSEAPTPYDVSAMSFGDLRSSAIGPVFAAADDIRNRVGEDRVHRDHLLAAALNEPASEFPNGFFSALGIPRESMRQLLQETIATESPSDAWDGIFAEPPASFDLAGGVSSDLVDPTTGIPLEEDHLGVGVEVTMFATLIAGHDTPLPLSIGLFGEWGSGKSYFMALLREKIAELARSPDPRYDREIVQIGFNAWHYADSNLWASLGDEIFVQLAGPRDDEDQRRKALRDDLDDKLQRRRELKEASARAKDETERLTKELQTAANDRRTTARSLATAVLGASDPPQELKAALDRLGVTDADEQIQLLTEQFEQTPQDVADLRRATGRLPRAWLVVALAIAVAAIALGIVASRALAGLGVAAVTVLTVAGGVLARVRSGARLLHQVAERYRRGQEQAVVDEQAALRQAETNERRLQAELDDVIGHVGELRRELAELAPGRRLYGYVAERAASGTYRGQLGLISTIRKDLEQLRTLMKQTWPEKTDDDVRRPFDKIVLYIDDLDRCSPQQVVEVLQAVHLLLALDLFVVVVGVDPRWLLHSLRREYRSLLTSGGPTDPRWQSTPQDYLEKIFNIPFALPRMTPASFGQLVDSFVDIELTDDPGALPRYVEGPSQVVAPDDAEPRTFDVETLTNLMEEGSEVGGLLAEHTVEPRRLTRPELEMLTALAPLVETPRETKRLVNLYRMLRATRDLSPAATFLGDEDTPGEYQAVVILLGLLSGHASLLHNVLLAPAQNGAKGGLHFRDPADNWAEFAAGLTPRATESGVGNDVIASIPERDVADWARLAKGLEEAGSRVTIRNLEPFQRWAPRIARFSFVLSPYADEDVAAMSRAAARR